MVLLSADIFNYLFTKIPLRPSLVVIHSFWKWNMILEQKYTLVSRGKRKTIIKIGENIYGDVERVKCHLSVKRGKSHVVFEKGKSSQIWKSIYQSQVK